MEGSRVASPIDGGKVVLTGVAQARQGTSLRAYSGGFLDGQMCSRFPPGGLPGRGSSLVDAGKNSHAAPLGASSRCPRGGMGPRSPSRAQLGRGASLVVQGGLGLR